MNLLEIKEQLAACGQYTFDTNATVVLAALLANRTHLCPERAIGHVRAMTPYELNVNERTDISNVMNTLHEFVVIQNRGDADFIRQVECFMTWRSSVAFSDHLPVAAQINGTDFVSKLTRVDILPTELLASLTNASVIPFPLVSAISKLHAFFHQSRTIGEGGNELLG